MASESGFKPHHPLRFFKLWADRPHARGRLQILPRRRAIRLFLFLALLVAALILPLSCATVVTPPAPPPDPQTVYLIDHGRTSSLVIPTRDGGLMRYVYGNWEWYALEHQKAHNGLRALLWPSQAALGRHRYPGPATRANVERIFGGWNEAIYAIRVGREPTLRLERELDRRYQSNISTFHENKDYELEFVKDPKNYWVFHDSNHEVAAWLAELGCKVRGPAVYSNWKVKPAPRS